MHEIWNKLIRFCNYQERCRHDILKKLHALEVSQTTAQQLIQKLEAENLLNETRYVQQFVNGHFKQKKWGRKKIEIALKSKNINPEHYTTLLNELLPTTHYQEQLTQLAHRKYKTIKGETTIIRKQKLFRFLLSKGYEAQHITTIIKNITYNQ
jgi:regulatory protein